MVAPGLIVAAPASKSGKTVITMGLLRCLARRGVAVAPAKVGPDYIDPGFHTRAAGRDCVNLDSWAMRVNTWRGLIADLGSSADLVVAEGVMGLFDGADVERQIDTGSTADLAAATGWPVVLVVRPKGQGASVGALLHGFATLRADVTVAGVIFNEVGSARHADILRRAAIGAVPNIRVLGSVPPEPDLSFQSRHLGLYQAIEHEHDQSCLDRVADCLDVRVDIDGLVEIARRSTIAGEPTDAPAVLPFSQHIAVARDAAFAFAYPHILTGWRQAGAELSFFSPLADEAPAPDATSVYLHGGYPELHAGRLAVNLHFLTGLRQAVADHTPIYGECGGYMVLGRTLTDANGTAHAMAGLLPLETTFAEPAMHLGYRQMTLVRDCALGSAGQAFRGHEFHYTSVTAEGPGVPLFEAADARGKSLGAAGLANGPVAGSFMHIIDSYAA